MAKKRRRNKPQKKRANPKHETTPAEQPISAAPAATGAGAAENSRHEEPKKRAEENATHSPDSNQRPRKTYRMSAFLSVLFLAVVSILAGVAIASWQKGGYQNYWIAFWWGIATYVLFGVGLFFTYHSYVIKPAGEAERAAASGVPLPSPTPAPTAVRPPELRAFLIPANDPMPAHPCGETPENMKVAFVGSMVTQFGADLKTFSLIHIANEDVLTVEYNATNAIVINATIRDESNNIVATIKKNVFHSYVPSGYEVTNPDPHSVLVLNATDQVVLYVRYLNPQAIKVLGVFRQPGRPPVRVEEGRFFIGEQEFAVTMCGKNTGRPGIDWWALKGVLVVE